MKELLKITHIKDDVCEIKVSLNEDGDGEQPAAALLGVLSHGGSARAAILAAVATYMDLGDEVEEVAKNSTIDLSNIPTSKFTC